MKQALSIGLKLIITVSVLYFVSRDVDWLAIAKSVGGANRLSIAVSFILLLALSLLQTVRWQAILRVLGTLIPYRTALSIVLVGIFFSQLLPTSIGGDAVRIWKLRQRGAPLSKAFNSVVLDRVSALLIVVLIITVGMTLLYDTIQSPVLRSLTVVAFIGTAGGMLLLTLMSRTRVIRDFIARLYGYRLGRLIGSGVQDASAVLLYPRPLAATLAISLFMQLGISVTVWVLAAGINVQISLMECLVLVPFVMLASMIPISIAGWGIREGAMIFALGIAGVDSTAALTISVLFGIILAATGVPGALLWLNERHTKSGKIENTSI